MATTVNPYRVTYTRQGGGWFARATDIRGAHSQGRSIETVRANIKEAIALVLDLPEGAENSIDLDETVLTGDAEVDKGLALAAELREQAEKLTAEAQTKTFLVMCRIADTNSDLSSRDLGNLLNMSHQRANQLIKSARVAVHNDDRDAIDA